MKIKIKEGRLYFWREILELWIPQRCMKTPIDKACAFWCPLFDLQIEKVKFSDEVKSTLHLCENRVYQVDELEIDK